MAKKAAKDSKQLTYNGKPLIKSGKKVYYGSPDEAFYVEMTINQSEQIGDLDISTDLTVDLMQKGEDGKFKKAKSEKKEGIYAAVDLAEKWLFEALGQPLE